ncbi:unnamed protein product [Meganyctiphanes norvegica]|uniref:Uncharacterized protein n=1 Tax=Meganyctiphanes norvegica TaxID=48144 RepID=A0AAV2RZE8_MEGNR
MRRPRTTPLQTGQIISKPPVVDTRSLPISGHQTFETPFIYEGRISNYGSMEELSSHALVQNEVAPFRKSSSHSVCLEKGIEVNLVGAAPRHESQYEVRVHSHGSRIGTTMRRVETSDTTNPKARMIHTPQNLGLQCRTESGSNASDVESLHLENM